MTSEEIGTGLKFQYQYDPRSRVIQVILPDMSSIEYSYNAANLQTIVRKNKLNTFSLNYHFSLSGKIVKIDLPNASGSIDFYYDTLLRPVSIASKNWSQSIPEGGYDSCGNVLRTNQYDSAGKFTSQYTYDSLYHLVSEAGKDNNTYDFDSLHNRIKKNDSINIVNALNQLTNQNAKNYTYDLNGNQSKIATLFEEKECQYDALNRLTIVISGNTKTEYLYDSFHRRLKKNIFQMQSGNWVKVDWITYMYQGDKEIGALNKYGHIMEMRTLGLGINGEIGAAVLMEIEDQFVCPLHDFRGNISALLDALDGHIVESYRYTAYGEDQCFDKSGNKQQSPLSAWRFSSKRIDPETNWAYFGRRYYDSETGKWTTPDPLGYIDSPNVYCFVRNRPMKYIDSDGRFLSAISEYIGNNYEWYANSIPQSCYHAAQWEDDPDMYALGSNFKYSSNFTVGTPVYSGVKLTSTNGIGNSLEDAKASAEIISKMAGGHTVYGTHNQDFGIIFNLIECSLGLMGIPTKPVHLLKESLEDTHENTHILHVPHSQGGIHTRNTLPLLDEELRQRMHIIAVAPANLMPKGSVKEAKHYVSRDFVPLIGMLFNQPNDTSPVVFLTPHPEAGWIDHSFNSKTFQDPLKLDISTFIEKYGKPL